MGVRQETWFGPEDLDSMDLFNLCAHQKALLSIFLIHKQRVQASNGPPFVFLYHLGALQYIRKMRLQTENN